MTCNDAEIVVARFWAKVNRTADHWLWTAGVDGQGNGAFCGVGGKQITARRFSWELENGAIPAGKRIESICGVLLCIHPAHLKLVSKGRVSKTTLEQRFWAQVAKTDGCWLWKGGKTNGYGIFSWWDSTTRSYRTVRANRMAYELTRGPISEGLLVCHDCDNPPCVNPAHFFLGTHTDNSRDREAKGRGRYGPNAPSKLKKDFDV